VIRGYISKVHSKLGSGSGSLRVRALVMLTRASGSSPERDHVTLRVLFEILSIMHPICLIVSVQHRYEFEFTTGILALTVLTTLYTGMYILFNA
jgi:hypothetical protein